MSKSRTLKHTSLWDTTAAKDAFLENGIKLLHLHKTWQTFLNRPLSNWSDVLDLPKTAVQLLSEKFKPFTSTVVTTKSSTDGETCKLLLQLQDGLQVEAVIMHYDTTSRYMADGGVKGQKRATLCISSQVGCQMGCTFCATGSMGLKGNLTSGEILEQLVHALQLQPIRNVVFMGMGEPLMNYAAVREAVELMTDPRLFGLARRHVTISTVGVIPRIRQLAQDLKGVSLALSLHAPSQELRAQLVPSARAHRLDRLLAAVADYQAVSGQRVFVEYVVLAGVNDRLAHAHELGQLLRGRDVVLNLIPWNPVLAGDGFSYRAPLGDDVARFQAVLRGEYGVPCTVRQEKGSDIAGACGQLVIDQQQRGAGGQPGAPKGNGIADVEDMPVCRA